MPFSANAACTGLRPGVAVQSTRSRLLPATDSTHATRVPASVTSGRAAPPDVAPPGQPTCASQVEKAFVASLQRTIRSQRPRIGPMMIAIRVPSAAIRLTGPRVPRSAVGEGAGAAPAGPDEPASTAAAAAATSPVTDRLTDSTVEAGAEETASGS